MGYNTDFEGCFDITPDLAPKHRDYLKAFADSRRVARNADATAKLPDPLREAVGLSVGVGGGYFVGATGVCGRDHTTDIVDYNKPPEGQPSLWCQWTSDDAGANLFAEGEKFYDYIEWLRYLITHFFEPWGYELNGAVQWSGEESTDIGRILVTANKVRVLRGQITYVEE